MNNDLQIMSIKVRGDEKSVNEMKKQLEHAKEYSKDEIESFKEHLKKTDEQLCRLRESSHK